MIWFIFSAALVVSLGLAGFLGFLFTFARGPGVDLTRQMQYPASIYYPFRETIGEGVKWLREHTFEQVYIKANDGIRLHARFLQGRSDRCIIMIHGYRSKGENDFSCACKFYHEQLGMSLLITTQRGNGRSGGNFVTFGVKERYDALSWAEYMRDRMGEHVDLFLTGVSMGASTVLMAADLPLPACTRGIIADCGFTCPEDIIYAVMQKRFRLPKFPLLHLMKLYACIFGFPLGSADARKALANTTVPVQLIHGRCDDFVPCYMTEENFAAATGEKYVFYSAPAGHGCSYLCDKEPMEKAISAFVESHLTNR